MKYKKKVLCNLGREKYRRASDDEAIELIGDISIKKTLSLGLWDAVEIVK